MADKKAFTVSLPCEAPGDFDVDFESRIDRIFEGIGFTKKIASGDPEFDRRFHVGSDFSAQAAAYFAAESHREAVLALFAMGFKSVTKKGTSLKATQPRTMPAERGAERVREASQHLEKLKEGLAQAFAGPIDAETRRSLEAKQKFFAIGGIALLAGVVLEWILNWLYPFVNPAFFKWLPPRIGFAAALLFLVYAVIRLRGRSSSHREVAFLAFVSLIGFPLFVDSIATGVNGAFDNGIAPAPVPAVVVGKHLQYGYSGIWLFILPTHAVTLQDWRGNPYKKVVVEVSSAQYKLTNPGITRYIVTALPGRLGQPWIKKVEIAP